MLTRCPSCSSTFKVKPEQLKVRLGKVRCGKCQFVFNALDSLVDTPVAGIPSAFGSNSGQESIRESPSQFPTPLEFDYVPAIGAAPLKTQIPPPHTLHPQRAPRRVSLLPEMPAMEMPPSSGASPSFVPDPNMASPVPSGTLSTPHAAERRIASPPPASPESLRDTSVAAGLVAVRDTTKIPGYSKWSEGAFSVPSTLDEPSKRSAWAFFLAVFLLGLTLVGQIAIHFRSELAVSAPTFRPMLTTLCSVFNCTIPLPRNINYVSIDSSDLQTDPARGNALYLAATLKNRATYAQAWPLLEITLTDAQDRAILRRVLEPSEYLPASAEPASFAARGEIGLKLWLKSKDIVASGYRLYVFYP